MTSINFLAMTTKLNQCSSATNEFLEDHLFSKNPIKLFGNWYAKARKSPEISLSHAMTLSTVSKEGRPSARIVLLQGFDESGFKFYTSLCSEKAKHLKDNPFAALVFYWMPLNQSIRIEGKVEHVQSEEANADFEKRARKSQLSMHVSNKQSQLVESRDVLMDQLNKITQLYNGKSVPRPEFIQGFRVVPNRIEFYQGHDTLISDRIVFIRDSSSLSASIKSFKGDNGWEYYRLGP